MSIVERRASGQSDAERVADIIDAIEELADEALSLTPKHMRPLAKAYWHAQVVSAVNPDGPYVVFQRGNTLEHVQEVLALDELEDEPECEDCGRTITPREVMAYRREANMGGDYDGVPRVCDACAEKIEL